MRRSVASKTIARSGFSMRAIASLVYDCIHFDSIISSLSVAQRAPITLTLPTFPQTQIDVEALEMQVAEKRQIEHIKREEDNQFNAENTRRANVLKAKADQLQHERHRVESEINEYRRKYQKKEDTREFDLNDPRRMQNAQAARIGDNDPRLGISSAQKFEGEDLMCPERHRVQRDQQRAWLQQQMQERRAADNDRAQADRQTQLAIESRDRRAQEMDAAERQTRDQIRASAVEYNRRLAESQRCKKLNRQREEAEDNLAEIYNNLTSDMLTGNRNCAESNFGVQRKVPANYRGMTDDELKQFLLAQEDQRKEHVVSGMRTMQINMSILHSLHVHLETTE